MDALLLKSSQDSGQKDSRLGSVYSDFKKESNAFE